MDYYPFKLDLTMQSPMDHGRDCSRSRARDHRTINDRTHIDENVASYQPTDNTRLIVDDGSRTTMQVMAAAPRNGQSRPEKRHIKIFSLAEKVSPIDRVHGGKSKASVARDIGVAESTLRGWCKSEHKICSQCNNVAIEMGPRHSLVNIGRSMSANGRQSVGSRYLSNSRQSSAIPDKDAPVAKKAKIDRTSRQNIPQTILPGPSTSWAGSFTGHNYNSDYAAALFAPMISSAQQNICTICTILPPLEHIVPRNYVSFAENGLQYTRTNNTTLPTIASSTIGSNSAIPAERGTLTTPPVTEPTFSSEIMQALRVAKMNPNNTGIEQAIEYGTWLQKWLNNCSIPLLAKQQLREHEYIVDVLKSVKNVQLKPQSEVVPETCKASAGSHDEETQL